MKATIRSHGALHEGHEEIHRFAFELHEGGDSSPVRETISLRTARVVVAHLEDGNALIAMLRAIVAAKDDDYDALIGTVYIDQFVMDGPGERSLAPGERYPHARSTGSGGGE